MLKAFDIFFLFEFKIVRGANTLYVNRRINGGSKLFSFFLASEFSFAKHILIVFKLRKH